MEIEFELVDKKHINIFGIQDFQKKFIGHIFTPSGSGHTILNGIQVCGFKEAFDLWGCAVFEHLQNDDVKTQVISKLKDKKQKYIRAKDIQLLFSFNTRIIKDIGRSVDNTCERCYNNPCSCENKTNHKNTNPYNVKRERDMLKKLKYKDDKEPYFCSGELI